MKMGAMITHVLAMVTMLVVVVMVVVVVGGGGGGGGGAFQFEGLVWSLSLSF